MGSEHYDDGLFYWTPRITIAPYEWFNIFQMLLFTEDERFWEWETVGPVRIHFEDIHMLSNQADLLMFCTQRWIWRCHLGMKSGKIVNNWSAIERIVSHIRYMYLWTCRVLLVTSWTTLPPVTVLKPTTTVTLLKPKTTDDLIGENTTCVLFCWVQLLQPTELCVIINN
jgi:hypothetical protein